MTESLKKRARLRTAICALALALCAHAFCFVNLTQSGQAVRIDLRGFAAESYASFNWLRPFYYRLLGGIAFTYYPGLLSTLFIWRQPAGVWRQQDPAEIMLPFPPPAPL